MLSESLGVLGLAGTTRRGVKRGVCKDRAVSKHQQRIAEVLAGCFLVNDLLRARVKAKNPEILKELVHVKAVGIKGLSWLRPWLWQGPPPAARCRAG